MSDNNCEGIVDLTLDDDSITEEVKQLSEVKISNLEHGDVNKSSSMDGIIDLCGDSDGYISEEVEFVKQIKKDPINLNGQNINNPKPEYKKLPIDLTKKKINYNGTYTNAFSLPKIQPSGFGINYMNGSSIPNLTKIHNLSYNYTDYQDIYSRTKNKIPLQVTFHDQERLLADRLSHMNTIRDRETQYLRRDISPIRDEEMENMYKNLLTGINEKLDLDVKREDTPENLEVQLLEHQKVGLSWMLKMEEGPIKGGLLSDEMGLGKTIQSLACVVKQKKSRLSPSRTLIVAPLALIYQWEEEINDKVKKRLLKVVVYHSSNKKKKAKSFKNCDIVLTTYNTLAIEFKKFMKSIDDAAELDEEVPHNHFYSMKWGRIILDEAHYIKNKNTIASKACVSLKSNYRWCLSGTPIQNSLEDLFPILSFLRVKPYTEHTAFSKDFNLNPKTRHPAEAFRKIRTLLEGISLRRCKNSVLDGKPILCLPEKIQETVELYFTPEEMEFYSRLEKRSADIFNRMVKKSKKVNMISVLVLLLRLRQTCTHPKLTCSDYKEILEEEGLDLNDKKDRDDFNEIDDNIYVSDEDIYCYICNSSKNVKHIKTCSHTTCIRCLNNLRVVNEATGCASCLKERNKINHSRKKAELENNLLPEMMDNMDLDQGSEDIDEFAFGVISNPSSSKINKMLEIVQTIQARRDNRKIIVYSQFVKVFEIIFPLLLEKGITCFKYDGSMSIEERTSCIDEFNKHPDSVVLLMSLRCGSVGLNLTSANCVIFMDLWWNPAIENQAMDRVHRIGQNSKVEVYKLVIPGSVEDRILKLQETKQSLFDGAFAKDGTFKNSTRLSIKDLKFLFGIGSNPAGTNNKNQSNLSIQPQILSSREFPSTNIPLPSRTFPNNSTPQPITGISKPPPNINRNSPLPSRTIPKVDTYQHPFHTHTPRSIKSPSPTNFSKGKNDKLNSLSSRSSLNSNISGYKQENNLQNKRISSEDPRYKLIAPKQPIQPQLDISNDVPKDQVKSIPSRKLHPGILKPSEPGKLASFPEQATMTSYSPFHNPFTNAFQGDKLQSKSHISSSSAQIDMVKNNSAISSLQVENINTKQPTQSQNPSANIFQNNRVQNQYHISASNDSGNNVVYKKPNIINPDVIQNGTKKNKTHDTRINNSQNITVKNQPDITSLNTSQSSVMQNQSGGSSSTNLQNGIVKNQLLDINTTNSDNNTRQSQSHDESSNITQSDMVHNQCNVISSNSIQKYAEQNQQNVSNFNIFQNSIKQGQQQDAPKSN